LFLLKVAIFLDIFIDILLEMIPNGVNLTTRDRISLNETKRQQKQCH
jgi:hypothetical protein